MAKGKHTGGRLFQKGNEGGPGRPPLPDDVKKIRELSRPKFIRMLNQYLHLPIEELEGFLTKNKKTVTGLEAIVISMIIKAVNEGDTGRLSLILGQLIGKPKEAVTPVDIRLGRMPAHSELLTKTAEIAYSEINRLEQKAKTEGLTQNEHRSLAILSKSLIDVKEKFEDDTTEEADEVRSMSDADLAKELVRLSNNFKVIAGGKKRG